MVDDAHFSLSLLCCFRTATSALNPGSKPPIIGPPASTCHSIPGTAPPHPRQPNLDQANMPRLLHRMPCRRGNSRGRPIHPPSLSLSDSTPSDSSSPSMTNHFSGCYPATHSGRRHVQPASSRSIEEAPQPPTTSISTLQPSHSA